MLLQTFSQHSAFQHQNQCNFQIILQHRVSFDSRCFCVVVMIVYNHSNYNLLGKQFVGVGVPDDPLLVYLSLKSAITVGADESHLPVRSVLLLRRGVHRTPAPFIRPQQIYGILWNGTMWASSPTYITILVLLYNCVANP